VNGANFTYDARGNLTATGSASYGYDVFNRLTSAGAATLGYDPAGRLYETVGGGVTTRFLYDGLDAIAEYNGSNVMQRRFVHGPGVDEPLVWYEGAGTSDRRWLVQDQLGSVIAVTNSAGAALSTNSYDEYGIPGASNTGRFQYTGQIWLPEASLYHYRARAYAPSLGRFLQSDPILYNNGTNLYAYVGADPVNWVDPLGLSRYEPPDYTPPTGGGGSANSCAGDPNCIEVPGTRRSAFEDYVRAHDAALAMRMAARMAAIWAFIDNLPAFLAAHPGLLGDPAAFTEIQATDSWQCQANRTSGAAQGAVVGGAIGGIAGATACSPSGPGAAVCAAGGAAAGSLAGGGLGWVMGGWSSACRNNGSGNGSSGGATPIPNEWSRFPGCNTQFNSDRNICRASGSQRCWASMNARLAHCNATGGEIGFPPLQRR
jgi:RHS repeat-associated protein